MKTSLLIALLTLAGLSGSAGFAGAEPTGQTTTGLSTAEATRLTLGRSVKKNFLGQWVYNETGEKIGRVVDMIIAADKNVSYLIIGVGGFIGIARHQVAIPVTSLHDQAGKIVLPGATKEMLKLIPRFNYASDATRRDHFVASLGEDLAKAKTKVASLKQKAVAASAETKVKFDTQAEELQKDVSLVEDKLAEMNQAAARKWRDFETDVNTAMDRLRKSTEKSPS